MPERLEIERRRIDVNPVQVAASAMAAISSAFLLSTLGVAGTVIGAALASVVATVGSAVYMHVVHRTSNRLRDVRAHLVPSHTGAPTADPAGVPDRPTGIADPGVPHDATIVLPVGGYEPSSPAVPTDSDEPPQGAPRRVWLVRSVVAAVVVFVIAMTAVTVAETALGQSFASVFGHGDKGGSTISNIVDSGPSRHEDPKVPAEPTTSTEDGNAPSTDEGDTGSDGEKGTDNGEDDGRYQDGTSGSGNDTGPDTTPSTQPTPSSSPSSPSSGPSEQPAAPSAEPSATPSTTPGGDTGSTDGDRNTSGDGANDQKDTGTGTGQDAESDTRSGSGGAADTGGTP